MRPEIEAYIRKHGARYTTETLRRMLIGVGHDPVEVDAALRETEAVRGPQLVESRTFGRWALVLHAGALVAMVLLVVLLNGTESFGIALIGAVVLGLFLLLSWAVSSLVGRALLPRTGMMVAIVVPLISALALSGTCVAIMDGMTPEPPRTGSVELTIDQPFSFDGSGMAFCYGETGGTGFGFSGEHLGTVDGRSVSAFVDSYAAPPEGQVPAPRPDELGVSVTLSPLAETDPPASWRNSVTTQLALDLSGNGGTVTFDELTPEPMGVPNPAPTDSEPMSGTLTWICDPPR
jgi:hypothetical protein